MVFYWLRRAESVLWLTVAWGWSNNYLLLVWRKDRFQDTIGHDKVYGGEVPAQVMGLDGQPLGGCGHGAGGGGRGAAAWVEQLVDQRLDVDVTVVIRGLDIVCTLLIFAQHCNTKVLDQILQIFSSISMVCMMMVPWLMAMIMMSSITKSY